MKEKIDIIREISHQKDSLAAEVEQLRDRCSSLQIQLNESMIERKAIKQEALDAERLASFPQSIGIFKP